MSFCGFTEVRPTLLVVGGSTGALKVNEAIWSCLDELTATYNIIHLCGKGKTNDKYKNVPGYVQYEYIKTELKDMLALADVVVSRAGANAICELLALKKPSVLIPLSREASRGDQILNAQSFANSGYAKLLEEENVTNQSLLEAVNEVYTNRDSYIKAMESSQGTNSISIIVDMLEDLVNTNNKNR
jgi:UDP-N-acetylglucosamine--N-acetylmuramyl-(pentapeptide) pyrophosphoryl-undecaprenol N-acetylglucosamine transferase